MAAKKKGIAKRKTTAVADIQKQLQAEAGGIQDQIGKPATNAIKIRDKVFTLPDGTVIQDLGPWYLLPANETRFIAVEIEESSIGTSQLQITLEAIQTSSIIYTATIVVTVN